MGKNDRPQGRNKEKELGCSETTLEKTIRRGNWGRRGLNVATLSVRLHSACKPRMIGRKMFERSPALKVREKEGRSK